jgi:hypothetical protein
VVGGLYDPNLPTHCAFDLGFTDATVCIWFQIGKDGSLRLVACEMTTGVDIFYHIEKIHQFPGEVGDVWLPHDARAKNLQTGRSVVEQFLHEEIRPRIVPNHKVRDGIAAVRRLFPRIHVDEGATGDLLEAMKAYRREWNDNLLIFSDVPVHDWASDYCDCLRYVAVACGVMGLSPTVSQELPRNSPLGLLTESGFNLSNLFEDNEAKRGQMRRIG